MQTMHMSVEAPGKNLKVIAKGFTFYPYIFYESGIRIYAINITVLDVLLTYP